MIMTLWKKVETIWEDRDERNVIYNIFLAFVVKGLSLLISLFSMPLYIKYFHDSAVLGLWYTILSLLSWISVCDLGLGNGLRNRLTEALTKNDADMGRKYISSTYVIVTCLIIPIIIVVNLIIRLSDLNLFFNLPATLVSNECLILSISILVIGVGVSFVLKLINNVIYAVQKSALNNVLALISSILPLIYVWLFNGGSPEENLIRLSLVHVAAINLPLVVVTVILFMGKTLKVYRPSIRKCDFRIAKSMLGFGMQFFLAQIFFMFIMSTNETFISRFFSPEYVVEYTIYNRISTLIGSFFTLALTPLWSKITKDLAQHHYMKIKQTNRLLYVLSLGAAVAQLMVVPVLQWVINIWLREDAIIVNYQIALIFAVYGGLYICNIVLTTVANGIGELKSQVVFYGVGSLLKIPAVMMINYYSGEWYLIVAYNCVVLASFCAYQIIWVEKRINRMIQTEE